MLRNVIIFISFFLKKKDGKNSAQPFCSTGKIQTIQHIIDRESRLVYLFEMGTCCTSFISRIINVESIFE